LVDAFSLKRDQVSYELFMNTLIEYPDPSRKSLVRNIFVNELDRNRTGYLAVSILKSFFNARNHPDVRADKLTEEDALRDFIRTLELYIGKAQKITREEFEKYYDYVSYCTPNDKRFEALISVWTISKDEQPKRRKVIPEATVEHAKRSQAKHEPPSKLDKDLIDLIKENILAKGLRCLFGIYRGFRVTFTLKEIGSRCKEGR